MTTSPPPDPGGPAARPAPLDDGLACVTHTEPRPEGEGKTVRVGRIEFVNCFPLYHHFEEELRRRGFSATIVEGYPSQLNEMLVDDLIDVALPSSIAFARAAGQLALLPDVSISAFGAVDSVQLFTRVPLRDVRRIALTEKSATSICLLKVLCREWGIDPEFVPRRGSLAEVLSEADGLLLIGDEALYVLRAEVYPYHHDLGEEWRTVTGLPMVFAVCAVRREFAAARPQAAAAVGAALLASRDRCAAVPQETAAAAAQRYDFSQRYLLEYFRKLRFEFTSEYRAGLDEFYRRAVAAGELVAAPDLEAATFRGPGAGGPGGGPAVAPPTGGGPAVALPTGGGRTATPAPSAGG
jgi:chorismate dehydratase